MALLGKLNWTNISSYLDKLKVSETTKKRIQSIFDSKATNADKTISFTDLVDLISEAKKSETKDKKTNTVEQAIFESEDEAYSAVAKYILGENFTGVMSNNKKYTLPGLTLKVNDDGSCTVTYNGTEFVGYKNAEGKIFFVNRKDQKTLKQTIKDAPSTDAAKSYHHRGRVGNDNSKYNTETGEINHGENKNSVSQVQTFASMLMSDNEDSTLTLDGQIRDGKRVDLSGQEIIDTMDSGQKDGKISIDELLKYLRAVVRESEGVVQAGQDTGSRIYASSVNLTTKDLVNIGELFKKYDADHDNLLDKDEFDNLIKDFKTRGNTATSLARSVTDIDEAAIVSDLALEDENNHDEEGYKAEKGNDGKYHYYSPEGTEITPAEFKEKCPTEYERLNPKRIKPETIPSDIQYIVNIYKIQYGKKVGNKLTDGYEYPAEIEFNTETQKYEMVIKDPTGNIKEVRIVLNETKWQDNLTEEELKQKEEEINDRYDGDIEDRKLERLHGDRAEDYFAEVITTFNDGRVVKGTYKEGELHTQEDIGDVESPRGFANEPPEEEQFSEPLEFTVTYSGDAAQYKEKLAGFEQSLKDNKARLMRELNLDNETYNTLARTAIAIAIKETLSAGTARSIKHGLIDLAPEVAETLTGGARSVGMTNIKYSIHVQDPAIKRLFESFGINEIGDVTNDAKSAIATMILLAQDNKILNSEQYQKAAGVAQGTYVQLEDYAMGSDGVARETDDGTTQGWENEVTRQDALCAMWNGGSNRRKLANGVFTTDWSYSNRVRRYANGITFNEDPTRRAEAIERHRQELREAAERAEATRVFNDMDNSGQMGSLVFMPKMYKNPDEYLNTAEEIEIIRNLPTLNNELKEQLITALQNGEIAFGFGLTQAEAESLKDQDVKLILKHLNTLRSNISAGVTTSDGITGTEAETLRTSYANAIGNAERDFRQEYQQNHADRYNDSGTNPTVLRATAQYTPDNESYVTNRGHRRGFQHVTPLSVNVNTTTGRISQQDEILATAAYNEARQSFEGGANCLTGVKNAMRAAGINVEDMVNYGTKPRHAKNWFDAHPNMFTQVKSVAVEDGKARDIVYSDIKSLPAGYFVIYVPESGDTFANEAGHIVITNGNGQGYSDSTDNLEWGNYYSSRGGTGKGEHGKFYVYKLNEVNWTVENGKLKYTGT
ncbi:MAG: hypothetical protein K6E29_06225 [Cyanobacteria bacterium RUI128]|nr:hypothetical protein [Cyanobacteria bacterium RUI128]